MVPEVRVLVQHRHVVDDEAVDRDDQRDDEDGHRDLVPAREVALGLILQSDLVFKGCNRKIKDAHTVFDWLSRDENVVSLYQSDEKCNFVFTATGFRDLFTLIAKANAAHTFRHTPRRLPLLFLAGDKDPIGKYGEGVRRVVNLYRGAGVKNIEVVFYKDARHEVLNELGRLETYGDISRWLEAQLTAQAEAADEQTARQAVN